MGPQAITRPAGSGLHDVVVVDGKGTVLEVVARRLPFAVARRVVARRHGG